MAGSGTYLFVDRTITSLSGSSQSLMAQNMARNIIIIENTGNANIGVNLIGTTAAIGGAATLTIVPNGSLIMDSNIVGNAITVIGTSGQPVAAFEA